MKTWWHFIIWNVIPSGVVCEERHPTGREIEHWLMFHKALTPRVCAVCEKSFWTWRSESSLRSLVCSSFKCFVKFKEVVS